MNAAWHRKHPLGRGASLAQRVKWHMAHQKACACRAMPASIQAALATPALDPRFAAVVKALRGEPDVTYGGKGFGASALKLDDKIFAMWTSRAAFVVKLDKSRVAELVGQKQGTYFDPGRGRLMKEWLEVTAPRTAWLRLAKEALAIARRA